MSAAWMPGDLTSKWHVASLMKYFGRTVYPLSFTIIAFKHIKVTAMMEGLGDSPSPHYRPLQPPLPPPRLASVRSVLKN